MQVDSETNFNLGIPKLSREETVAEITERLRCARLWYKRHEELMRHPEVPRNYKFQFYRFFIRPILTYGCELWHLDDKSSQRLLRFEYANLLEIYKSKYPHRHPKRLRPDKNVVYSHYKEIDIVDHVRNERLPWSELLVNEELALENTRRQRRVRWRDRENK